MSVLCISLFGKFNVQCGGQVVTSFDAHKVQELFCYLLLHRDRPHSREVLADLLWGDHSTAQSKCYLRKALWQLQAALNLPALAGTGPVLLVEPEWIRLNREADLWLDVAEFEEVFTLTQGVPGRELDYQYIQTLQHAADLYKGDLLEGWYQDWCLHERERLQHLYLAMLDKLMDYCEAHQEYEAGLVYGARILRYDRARERTHRRLMRLQYLAGDRSAALRQYERCVAVLDEELGVKPAERTVTLYKQIRADQLDDPLRTRVESTTTSNVVIPPLPGVLLHLKQLEVALANLHHQIQQAIQAVETVINGQH